MISYIWIYHPPNNCSGFYGDALAGGTPIPILLPYTTFHKKPQWYGLWSRTKHPETVWMGVQLGLWI